MGVFFEIVVCKQVCHLKNLTTAISWNTSELLLTLIKLFHSNEPILYSLENVRKRLVFLYFQGGIEKIHHCEMGLKSANYCNIFHSIFRIILVLPSKCSLSILAEEKNRRDQGVILFQAFISILNH